MTTQPINDVARPVQSQRLAPSASQSRAARFWDRIARRYAAKPVADQDAYANKLAMTQTFLTPESEVLEIGCGSGSTALEHGGHVRHVHATDISGGMIEVALERALDTGIGNVDFAQCGAREALALTAAYDAILALNLLHLLSDWRRTLEDAHRCLRPGGVLVTSTPCLMDEHAWLRRIAPIGARLGLMPELSFFTQAELETEVCNSGFIVECTWQANARNGLFLVARRPR